MIITGETLKVDATRTIEVVKGETLSQIAKDFDVEVEDIKEWNDLDSDLILIGQELEFDIPLEKFNEKVEAREGGQAVQSSNRNLQLHNLVINKTLNLATNRNKKPRKNKNNQQNKQQRNNQQKNKISKSNEYSKSIDFIKSIIESKPAI